MIKLKKLLFYVQKGMGILLREGPFTTIRRVRYKWDAIQRNKAFHTFHIRSAQQLEKERAEKFDHHVVFSILTPLYNTPETFLLEMIHSVQEQTYPNWELCLADGSDAAYTYVGDICVQLAQKDPRIRYFRLEQNLGISENTNACIDHAAGDYFALLDHDDVLHPSALYEVMKAITIQGADFIYTDEAKFFQDIRQIHDPNFKGSFAPDELRAHNYICHFNAYSRELLNEVGRYRREYDGSQDHDMVLRLTEKARSAVHIPQVLYYWRVHQNSVSFDLSTKSYAVKSALNAVTEQLYRLGLPGTVESALPFQTIYRVRYELTDTPLVSVLVHSAASDGEFDRCARLVWEHTSYPNIEILRVRDWRDAAGQARGRYLMLLHASACELSENWMQELLMFAQRGDVGAAGPKVCYADHIIYHAGLTISSHTPTRVRYWCHGQHIDSHGYEACLRHVRQASGLWEGCMLVKKELFMQMNGFDGAAEGYEGMDLCLRLEDESYRIIWTPFALCGFALPRGGLPEGTAQESTTAFEKRWKIRLRQADPHCNPYLEKFLLV